ncbi:hypothetical protein HMPREF9058_2407 [Actinomyces sp. oral taxon 175 str. F0384]|nr:hypothetical protein HMPREF9058_2407 [Actinomyces sp. oral taxon 175 str. F0384]
MKKSLQIIEEFPFKKTVRAQTGPVPRKWYPLPVKPVL